jgi:hypothetical protein
MLTYIKRGTPAQILLERGSAMTGCICVTKSSESQICISRGIILHTVVGHFQLWNFFVDLDMLNIFAV